MIYYWTDIFLADSLPWKILKNDGKDDEDDDDDDSDDVDYVDCSYAYISNNPVGAHLIKKDWTYYLSVNQ